MCTTPGPPLKFQSMIRIIIIIMPYFWTIPIFLCLVLLLKYTKTQKLQGASPPGPFSFKVWYNLIMSYFGTHLTNSYKSFTLIHVVKPKSFRWLCFLNLLHSKYGMTSINYVILWFIITNTTIIVHGFTFKIHETPRASGGGGCTLLASTRASPRTHWGPYGGPRPLA